MLLVGINKNEKKVGAGDVLPEKVGATTWDWNYCEYLFNAQHNAIRLLYFAGGIWFAVILKMAGCYDEYAACELCIDGC